MRWLLKRNCSASPHQLALVFASLVAVSLLFGVAFAAHGLWLVLPFVGLEMLAVALAFVSYGRHAADCERIEVGAQALTVERFEGGRRQCWTLAPGWARVEVDRSGQGWMGRVRLFVTARGERVEIGRHLPDQRRLRLAEDLRRALLQVATPDRVWN